MLDHVRHFIAYTTPNVGALHVFAKRGIGLPL
jgi:hypothetical protein